MEPILLATASWQTTTALVTDELWQCINGNVQISVVAISATVVNGKVVGNIQGTRLTGGGSGTILSAGQVVRYKSEDGTVALISREPR